MDDFTKRYISARKQVIARDFPSLNSRQQEAVLATEGPLLVLAGAGSGKTTVLINRIANIMKYGRGSDSDELPPWANNESLDAMEAYLSGNEEQKRPAQMAAALDPVQPWQILAITFTNKAAGEMKERLCRLLGSAGEEVWARTFHSTCVRILRRDGDKLGYPNSFTIYDTTDRTAVMKRLIKEQNRDEKIVPPKWVLNVIDKAKDKLQSPADLAEEAEKNKDFRLQTAAVLYEAYAKRMQEDGAMDFEDLIYNTVRLFREFPNVLEKYQHQFRYVLIDEYQDTNNLQYLLASLLAGGHHNICVVGDDDQSIYAFRGATIENILSFENQYPGARVIRLEQNYRSTGHILDAANSVVAHNTGRKGKRLWTQAGAGERITLYVAQNENEEARYVVQQILQAVRQGARLGDHAVLYRLNAQSRALEQAFLCNGIRPRIVKGNPFFERAEIKDIMAYFFVIQNPADELRLLRIINVPPRGIGNTTQERAQAVAVKNGLPLFSVMAMADRFPELGRGTEKLKNFANIMEELSVISCTEGLEELYDAILEKTGYVRSLQETKTEENLNRLENVQELKSFIVTHVQTTGDNSLTGFLDEVSLYTDLQNVDEEEDTVTLMTIHSAKGLEFPTVFIVGMEEGVFPSLQAIGEPDQMEEERRLAYVAITRAKERLYITSARQRMVFGQTASHRISRFADEIPPEHIDRPWQNMEGPNQWETRFDFLNIPREKSQQKRTLAPPARPKSSDVNLDDFHKGDRVRHTAFRDGTIVSITRMGGDALVEIQFDGVGTKRLMLKAAMRHMEKI